MGKSIRLLWLLLWNVVVMPIGVVADLALAPLWVAKYKDKYGKLAFKTGCMEIKREYLSSWEKFFDERQS